MDSTKVYALLLIAMLCLSSSTPILGCRSCGEPGDPVDPKGPITLPPLVKPPIHLPQPIVKPPLTLPHPRIPPVPLPHPIVKPPVTLPHPKLPPVTLPPIVKPPVTLPPIVKPPITLPPIVKPPVTLPPIVKPPVTLPPIVKPPVTLPPIVKPPITLPPIVKPPITVPPILQPPVVTPPGGKPCPQPAGKETCPIDTLKLGVCVDLLGGLVHVGVGDPVTNQCCPVLAGLVELEAAVCLCTTLKHKLLNLNVYVPLALQLLVACGKTPPPGYTCTL